MSDPIGFMKSASGNVDSAFVDKNSYDAETSTSPSIANAIAATMSKGKTVLSDDGTSDSDSAISERGFGAIASHPMIIHSYTPKLGSEAEAGAECELWVYRANVGKVVEKYSVQNGVEFVKEIYLGSGDGVFLYGKKQNKVRYGSSYYSESPSGYLRHFGMLMQVFAGDNPDLTAISMTMYATINAVVTPIEVKDGLNIRPRELEVLKAGGYYKRDGEWVEDSSFSEFIFPTYGMVGCVNFVWSDGAPYKGSLHFAFFDEDKAFIGGQYIGTSERDDFNVFPIGGTRYVGIPMNSISYSGLTDFVTGEAETPDESGKVPNRPAVSLDVWENIVYLIGRGEPEPPISPTFNRKFIAFGDSITYGQTSDGTTRAENPWPNRVASVLGLTLDNAAEGGMGLVNTDHNPVTALEKVKRTDMSGAALITVAFGRNDSGKPLGTSADESGSATICGQLKAIFDYIESNSNKYVQVVCISPTRASNDFDESGSGGWTIAGYGDNSYEKQVGEICKEHRIPLVGWSELTLNRHWTEICSDNVHPDTEGYRVMGAYMAGKISGYFA